MHDFDLFPLQSKKLVKEMIKTSQPSKSKNYPHKPGYLLLRRTSLIALAAIALTATIILIRAMSITLPGEEITPAGYVRNSSLYLEVRDGTKIAVELWFPADLKPGVRVPALVRATRYWRNMEYGLGSRIMYSLGLSKDDGIDRWGTRIFNEQGYAVVLLDARGSGASYGQRPILWHPDEAEDFGEVVDWIVQQDWSNGKVGGFGISYEGNTSIMLASTGRPAVKAVSPLFDVYDLYRDVFAPGGIFNQWFIHGWSSATQLMDKNDICGVTKYRYNKSVSWFECQLIKFRSSGVKPIDSKQSSEYLASAVSSHQTPNVYEISSKLEFQNEPYGNSGLTLFETSGAGYARKTDKGGAAIYAWASWLDSGMGDGSLRRFLTASNPHILMLGPWTHGGFKDVDLIKGEQYPVEPSVDEQYLMRAHFFDKFLKTDKSEIIKSEIIYMTMGERGFKHTETWPPNYIKDTSWYLSANSELSRQRQLSDEGSDNYVVDFSTSSGNISTRWHTAFGGVDVYYPDRRDEDKKLLTYTGAPLVSNVEITGNPVLTLFVSSSTEDSAFHVYLEHVAPDGTVNYITEGLLRAINRKVSSNPPHAVLGPYHTLKREDAAPMVPGSIAKLEITLYATSILIPKGHRLRLALAGADTPVFSRYPASGPAPIWDIQRNSAHSSRIDIPLKFHDQN